MLRKSLAQELASPSHDTLGATSRRVDGISNAALGPDNGASQHAVRRRSVQFHACCLDEGAPMLEVVLSQLRKLFGR